MVKALFCQLKVADLHRLHRVLGSFQAFKMREGVFTDFEIH